MEPNVCIVSNYLLVANRACPHVTKSQFYLKTQKISGKALYSTCVKWTKNFAIIPPILQTAIILCSQQRICFFFSRCVLEFRLDKFYLFRPGIFRTFQTDFKLQLLKSSAFSAARVSDKSFIEFLVDCDCFNIPAHILKTFT